ncbi:MAG: SH3 domain-containing protein [Rhizobiales bacterium]|nr:SH3 domain-containing protein [Hyphomicrobiales bacterium]
MRNAARLKRIDDEEVRDSYPHDTFAAAADDAAGHGEDRPVEPSTADHLVAELEAALLADLHSVRAFLEPASPPDPLPEPTDDESLNAEALRRLLDSIGGPIARSEPESESVIEAEPAAMPAEEAAPVARATPPRRRAAAAAAPSARAQSSLFIGATLLALAGGSAFVTVQSVTAHGDPEAAPSAAAPPEDTASAPAAVDAGGTVAEAVPTQAEAQDVAAAPAAGAKAPLAQPAVSSGGGAPVRLVRLGPDDAAPPPAAQLAERPAAEIPAAAEAPAIEAPVAPAAERPNVAALDAAPAAPMPRAGEALRGPARITADVKLRSNPDNGAPVVGLLATGTSVVVVGCKGWCEVVAGDKRGFVFRKFLGPVRRG